MFDVGFWELSLIAVLALVILGPERLPVVARTLGGWVRRARHFVSNFGEELTGDSSIQELRNEVRNLKSEIESETSDTADRVSRMGMSDDLNGHESADADATNEHPRSIYEFNVDDVDDMPDITIDGEDSGYGPVGDDSGRDAVNMEPEYIGTSPESPEAVAEYVDSRHDAGHEALDDDDEALYVRARQRYLASGDENFGDNESRPENDRTDRAEPSDRA